MLYDAVWAIVIIIEISIFGYFFYVSSYNFILSFAGLFANKIILKKENRFKKIVVLFPAYKEDEVIVHSISEALKLNYAENFFEIVVIADSFKSETLQKLREFPILVHEVTFSKSTKVKAINSALNIIEFDAEIIVVFDADNIPEREFLNKVNYLFSLGYKIIQGKRIIKNPKNQLALLDDLSEQINNHINRKGCNSIGGSSSIAGSGFAVDFNLGKEIFFNLNSVGGFDKEFELAALLWKVKTKYIDDLIVYDEKVESKEVFKTQRTRWIASQYDFLKKYFRKGVREMFRGNLAFFNSSILRNLQLPRLLNLGLFSLTIICAKLIEESLIVSLNLWIIVFIIFLLSILIAIPKSFYNFRTMHGILQLPGIFFVMLLIMFKLKGANKEFLHTPHNLEK